MKANMHLIDRIVRVFISVTLVILYFSGYFTGTIAIIALSAAIIFTITGLVGFCPLYTLLGLSTRKKNQ